MGAWDAGNFDNDDACDWGERLEKIADLSLVLQAFAQALDKNSDYLEAPVGSEALAACEVIARMKGNWGLQNPYTETVDNWVKAHPQIVPKDLIDRALLVIDRVLSPKSELAELWAEVDASEWHAVVEDLRKRVRD